MTRPLVVVTHGIGDHRPDFHKDWEVEIQAAVPDGVFDVVGLYWGDVQDRIAQRYDVVSETLSGFLSRIGSGAGDDFRDGDAHDVIQKFAMDVFAYCLFHDMRHFIQSDCLLDLLQKTEGRENHTILIGHSLGAALMPHIVQLERRVTGRIPYRGLVLLAPPLGIKSPMAATRDPLAVTPTGKPQGESTAPRPRLRHHLVGGDTSWIKARDYTVAPTDEQRLDILEELCTNWRAEGPGRLHFCINKNDMVCSDVRFQIGDEGRLRDLVPAKQGYSPDERAIIEALAQFHELDFGAPKVGEIGSNHDAVTYLRTPQVRSILQSLLGSAT